MRHFRVPIAKALIVTLALSLCVPLVAPAWADGPKQVNEDQSPDPRELNAGDPDDNGGSGLVDPGSDLTLLIRRLIGIEIQLLRLNLGGFGALPSRVQTDAQIERGPAKALVARRAQ